ncbi:MAG: ATPase, partial [Proteobacteria bacterium]|nr:ATPase [Pseudomonadota bacterium]
LQATAECLSAIILMQIANVFLCKTSTHSLFRAPLLDNRIILCGIALEIALLLAIVYAPAGRSPFGTAPLGMEIWLFMLPFAFGMILLEEARKWLVSKLRKRPRDRSSGG